MEHNILVIKPDADRLDYFLDLVVSDLCVRDFEVVATRKLQLDLNQFQSHFVKSTPLAAAYYTGGPMIAILYRGGSAVAFGRQYKYLLREKYKKDKLRNVLHSTEPGNEFVLQFSLFFPDMALSEHHQFGDQGVNFDAVAHWHDAQLQMLPPFNILIDADDDRLSRVMQRFSGLENCGFVGLRQQIATDTTMIAYHAIDDISLTPVHVLHFEQPARVESQIQAFAGQWPVDGVVCYHPHYTLDVTDNLRATTLAAQLICVAGSFGASAPGMWRGSEELHQIFAARFAALNGHCR